MRTKVIAVGSVLLLLFGAWFWGSPYWTLRQMANAAENRDGTQLATYIDFPPLRESLKSQLKAQMAVKMATEQKKNPFAALGAMIAVGMVDSMIDGFLTPDAMEAMFAKAKADDPEPKQRPMGFSLEKAEVRHDGINQFSLVPKKGNEKGATLVFARHGLGWKLSDIRMPPDLMDGPPGAQGAN